MTERKHLFKKIASAVMACACAFTIFGAIQAPVTAEAKTTTFTGFYQEGGISVTTYGGTVKSVSSTNKKVATVSKNKTSSSKADIYFKKAGKATVKVKSKGYRSSTTFTYKFNLKDAASSFAADLETGVASSYSTPYFIKLENNSGINFERALIGYTFYDVSGNSVLNDTVNIRNVNAGSTAYSDQVFVKNELNVDPSKTKIWVAGLERYNITNNYKTLSKKQYTVNVTPATKADGYNTYKVIAKNKSRKKSDISATLILKDANGQIVGSVRKWTFYLKPGNSDSYTFNPLVKSDQIASYDIVYSAVCY